MEHWRRKGLFWIYLKGRIDRICWWIGFTWLEKERNMMPSRFWHLEQRTLSKTAKDIGRADLGFRNSVFGGLSPKHPSGNVKWTAAYLKLGLKKEVWVGDINLGILA